MTLSLFPGTPPLHT